MNAFVVESGTLTNSASRTFSLLAMTDVFGDVVTFSRVNFLAIKAGTHSLDFGGVDTLPDVTLVAPAVRVSFEEVWPLSACEPLALDHLLLPMDANNLPFLAGPLVPSVDVTQTFGMGDTNFHDANHATQVASWACII
jgi:hypothetical protein